MPDAARRTVVALTLGALLVGPFLARADDAETAAALDAFEARLMMLEDKLAASEATVAVQREILRAQTPQVSQGGVDRFLQGLEFGGHVTASYLYNANNPDSNTFSQTLCQFNCNHNEFSLDAVKLEIGKPASEPGSAGFQVDLLYGQNADILKGLSPDGVTGPLTDPNSGGPVGAAAFSSGSSDTSLFVQEAWVSYNAAGVEAKLGKWETLLGAEVLDSHLNYNVSHGLLFTWAIPLYHTGILASGNLTEEIGWALGVANGFNNSIDEGDGKAVLGQLSFAAGPLSAAASTYVGTTGGFSRVNTAGNIVEDDDTMSQIYDLVVHLTPTDQLDLWANVDYGRTDFSTEAQLLLGTSKGEATWWGAAAGFNVDLTERLSFALRGEWFLDDNNSRFGFTGVEDTTAISATGTIGYKLSDNLLARLEVRHDRVDTDPDVDVFPNADRPGITHSLGTPAPSEDQATYGILEVSYVFD